MVDKTDGHPRRINGSRVDAYEELKEAIREEVFHPGEVLREVQLAEWCGVSRTPIREALRRLEQDGLVHWEGPNLTVRGRSPEEILDIYSTRIVLEGMAAGVAAERRTEHDLRQLNWLLERGDGLPGEDLARVEEANAAFNRQVWSSSHNEALIGLLERLNLHLGRCAQTTLATPGRWEQSKKAHHDLVAAIERRDSQAARDISERHITEARELRLALFGLETIGV